MRRGDAGVAAERQCDWRIDRPPPPSTSASINNVRLPDVRRDKAALRRERDDIRLNLVPALILCCRMIY